MLHEAYYPSELSDNKPIKIFYGFEQADISNKSLLTLVVFYPHLTGTSLFNLSDEKQDDLALFLLNKHIFGVTASFIKVAFICKHINEKDFYGEQFDIDISNRYFYEINEKMRTDYRNKYGVFIGNFLSQSKIINRINSKDLTIGSTSKIRLVNKSSISIERAEELIKALKKVDFGSFNSIFGDN